MHVHALTNRRASDTYSLPVRPQRTPDRRARSVQGIPWTRIACE